ncbi:MAG: SUMF1/EgtB/PvdO family nonheme iron enzyme [Desulfamplus sp.]|nr:SUMF1/EgtB/PvdO family nonheme iron enzyme [Desulfamplus sp.]
MANVSITQKGVDQAIASLTYKDGSMKKRVILAIRQYYDPFDDAISKLQSIDSDELIKAIWDTGDDINKIKSKRRNFYSIRSSINSDLAALSHESENPEKITITSDNIFDMTEEAKNSILSSFSEVAKSGNLDMSQITDILKTITEMVAKIEAESLSDNPTLSETLEQIKSKLLSISEPVEELDEETEIVDVEEDEELEEVEDVEEIDDDTEIVDVDDEELEELEEVEDVEEIDDDTEIVDVDDEELEELEEVEDVEEIDDDTEIVDVDDKELEEFEEFKKNKELARQFDDLLADADKRYNTYVVVPAGIYTVGSIRRTKNKLELQQIEMQKLYIAKYPVTNSLFEIFIQETGYITTAEKKGYGTVFYGRFKRGKNLSTWRQGVESADVKGACWYQPEGIGSSLHNKRNHPVVQVSIDDALMFASWIGRRLPTETEWEAAARTDMGFKYPWGNEWEDARCNIEKSSISDTTPVDKYEEYQNLFAIADILGNVMEWTSDVIDNPFSEQNLDSDKNFNPSKSRFHIAKGCGWTARDNITIGSRALFKPQYTSNTVGFRCLSEYLL